MTRIRQQFDRMRHLKENAHVMAGFTLVELLVVMAIFVILATLTISGFRGNDSDRISAATATLRNALEGARSRAIKSGQVRGLRLITDPNNNAIVTSLIYIGAPESGYDDGIKEQDRSGLRITSIDSTTNRFFVTNLDSGVWANLFSQGLLFNPNDADATLRRHHRIEIPAFSGNWYNVFAYPGTGDSMTVSGFYMPSQWQQPSGPWVPVPTVAGGTQSQALEYRLELAPIILPGAEPIPLPRNTCIDLVGSSLPTTWYSGTNLDILFTPRGTGIGDVLSQQIVHLVVADVGDVTLAGSRSKRQVIADPEKGNRLVTLFAQTGGIVIAEVNPASSTSNSGFNNDIASNPFSFAFRGKEAK